MKTSLGQFFWFHTHSSLLGLAGLAHVTSRQNCKWEWKMAPTPLSHKPCPSIGRGQQDGRIRWAEDFFGLEALHTEKREKTHR